MGPLRLRGAGDISFQSAEVVVRPPDRRIQLHVLRHMGVEPRPEGRPIHGFAVLQFLRCGAEGLGKCSPIHGLPRHGRDIRGGGHRLLQRFALRLPGGFGCFVDLHHRRGFSQKVLDEERRGGAQRLHHVPAPGIRRVGLIKVESGLHDRLQLFISPPHRFPPVHALGGRARLAQVLERRKCGVCRIKGGRHRRSGSSGRLLGRGQDLQATGETRGDERTEGRSHNIHPHLTPTRPRGRSESCRLAPG